jgi:hypothetical protein
MGAGDRYIDFNLAFNTAPASVPWYVDGTGRGNATGSNLNWGFQWDLGLVDFGGSAPYADEILDGVYTVTAKGIDQYGQAGTAKASTVIVNRRLPYPPPNPHAGRNDGNAYIDWGTNSERDVEGYRVYRVQAGGDQLVCNITRLTRCKENGMPSGAQQYYAVAVDRNSSGQRDGDKSAYVTIPAANTPPTAPASVSAAKQSSTSTVISWSASSDTDAGDSVQFYRIYRDGTDGVGDYYARTASGSSLSYTDSATNDDEHTYYVVAVDQSYTESRPPVPDQQGAV